MCVSDALGAPRRHTSTDGAREEREHMSYLASNTLVSARFHSEEA